MMSIRMFPLSRMKDVPFKDRAMFYTGTFLALLGVFMMNMGLTFSLLFNDYYVYFGSIAIIFTSLVLMAMAKNFPYRYLSAALYSFMVALFFYTRLAFVQDAITVLAQSPLASQGAAEDYSRFQIIASTIVPFAIIFLVIGITLLGIGIVKHINKGKAQSQ